MVRLMFPTWLKHSHLTRKSLLKSMTKKIWHSILNGKNSWVVAWLLISKAKIFKYFIHSFVFKKGYFLPSSNYNFLPDFTAFLPDFTVSFVFKFLRSMSLFVFFRLYSTHRGSLHQNFLLKWSYEAPLTMVMTAIFSTTNLPM